MIEVAKKQKEQAEIGYRKALNTIALEVDTARTVINSRERLEASKKAKELAAKNLEDEDAPSKAGRSLSSHRAATVTGDAEAM